MEHTSILSVSDLTKLINDTLKNSFGMLTVSGELSNFVRQSSGHWYFTLKDSEAQLSAVMFRTNTMTTFFRPQNGMEVVCRGRLAVYAPRGQYQLIATDIQPRGEGALQIAFEKLKRDLYAEGLFDETKKKKLPAWPTVVALVTSGTGAAVRDLISVITRRNPTTQILVVPVQVQGPGAAEKIAEAIYLCNDYGTIDVIITGRGGGSIEDLWAFNEEIVARAIAASDIPVVSAVGHEIDFTIADFVADLRAATPSVAGELVVPSLSETFTRLQEITIAAGKLVDSVLQRRVHDLRSLSAERASSRIGARIRTLLQLVDESGGQLHWAMNVVLERLRHEIELSRERVTAHAPERFFNRGAVFLQKNGSSITSAAQLQTNDNIEITLRDGKAQAAVTMVKAYE